jgi:2-polyprenyl-3-methyl-5-hydroxy-6-metoxy-1,4-benzoquinol methylase
MVNKNLAYYRKIKSKNKYNLKFISSSLKKEITAKLGTIEMDVCGFFGKHKNKESFRGEKIINYFSQYNFKTCLDIGGGDGRASKYLSQNHNKIMDIIELHNSFYFKKLKNKKKINKIIVGDFLKIKLKKNDAILCSHVLEHQPNIGLFLCKLREAVKENGYVLLITPPRKPFIISGHLNIFNSGLILYRLILAKFNCKNALVFNYDYNQCIILQKKTISLPALRNDLGDLDKIKKYFPKKIFTGEGFNGDIIKTKDLTL